MNILPWLMVFAERVDAPKTIFAQELNDSTVTNVVNVVLGLAGAIAVAFVIFSGIKYALSQGDPGKVKAAKDGILYALVGIVVVSVAFMLVNFVIGKF